MSETAERPLWARRTPLELEEAEHRTTAYVYGNLLVLAAVLAVPPDDVVSGRAFWIVGGTAVSTFVAHVFAESMGAAVRAKDDVTLHDMVGLVRGSLPVLTSGGIPCVILLLGWLGMLPETLALTLAEALLLLRIAGTGIVVARLRDERSSVRLFLIGVVVAVVGALVSALKVYLTH